jgi:hypothetical protein
MKQWSRAVQDTVIHTDQTDKPLATLTAVVQGTNQEVTQTAATSTPEDTHEHDVALTHTSRLCCGAAGHCQPTLSTGAGMPVC